MSPHIEEEDLERYSMQVAPEAKTAEIEEHLLLCEWCQKRLTETDNYVRAFAGAAKELRTLERQAQPRPRIAPPRLRWSLALAAGVIAAILAITGLRGPMTPPVAVVLQTVRGEQTNQAPAQKALELLLDSTGLPAAPAYRIEVVTDTGARVWSGPGHTAQQQVSARISGGVPAGTYYVRLYSPGAELLREFGLEVVRKPAASGVRR